MPNVDTFPAEPSFGTLQQRPRSTDGNGTIQDHATDRLVYPTARKHTGRSIDRSQKSGLRHQIQSGDDIH
ncbi:MAG: hypothetical protein ABI112_16185 [Terracoccus sp.]